MSRFVLFVVLMGFTLSGCGVDWFPESSGTGTSSNPSGTSQVATVSAFSFSPASATGVTAGSTQTSSAITVALSGASSAPISVSGGQYKIGNGSFTSSAGTVSNNQQVTVQHTAAQSGETVTTLTIGDKSATFTSTTAATLITVNDFAFSPALISAIPGGSQQTSNAITVVLSGGTSVPIGVTGGEYQINNGSFTSAAGTVNNGDTVKVRNTAASVAGQRTTTTLTIGSKSATFSTIPNTSS